MQESNGNVIISAGALTQFCTEVFAKIGLPQEQATAIAANLVEADVQGVASHGVVRLPIYVRRLRAGVINAHPNVHVTRETSTTAVIDGDNGMGQWVGMQAMKTAIHKGLSSGCAFVSVRNSNHFGAAAYYAHMAIAHDMIGFSFTIGGINHMTPWGGAEAILGNNPLSIALPAGEERPIVLDMACSVAARGKIIVAAKDGAPIPNDWATGPDGQPTTDPIAALKGFILPVGGPKGYALTLMIGLLSTMLSGAAFGSEVTDMYQDLERAQNVGHLFGVLSIACFEDLDVYKRRIDKAIREIRSVPRAPGVDRIYLPGEREQIAAEQQGRSGIPIKTSVWSELIEVGASLGVALQNERSASQR